MQSNKCNGYANYPTFAVVLWLDNEEGLQREASRIAREADPSNGHDAFESFVEEFLPTLDGMAGDLFEYARGMIDWHEVYEHFAPEDDEETIEEDAV